MKTQLLRLSEGTIAFEEVGKGPLVVCAPSMGDLRGEYRFIMPQLAAAGYRAVSMDVRGHGESSVRWPDYSVAGIGSDLLALVHFLDAGPAALYGTSMAAGAAVWAAAEDPKAVSGLVLSGPFVRGGGSLTDRLLYSTLFARPWGPAIWLKYYASLYPTHKPADFESYSRVLKGNLKKPGRLEALVRMITASKSASEERLSDVNKPTLVLMGSKDPDFKHPEQEARWVAEELHSSYRLIEGAGHYPHAEMPEVVAPIIASFIDSIRIKHDETKVKAG